MRYRLEVVYQTPHMAKVSEWMGEIMEDWAEGKKQLLGIQSYEFTTDEPLTDEKIREIEATCPEWADNVKVIPIDS